MTATVAVAVAYSEMRIIYSSSFFLKSDWLSEIILNDEIYDNWIFFYEWNNQFDWKIDERSGKFYQI